MSVSDKLAKANNGVWAEPATLTTAKHIADTSAGISVATGWPVDATDGPVHFKLFKTGTDGKMVVGSDSDHKATLSGTTLSSIQKTGGPDTDYEIGDSCIIYPTAGWANDVITAMRASHNNDGTLKSNLTITTPTLATPTVTTPPANIARMTGEIVAWALRTAPTGWLFCDGSAVSRSTYSALFAAVTPTLGTVTITIASPGVVSLTAHGMLTGDAIFLTTTGALPTGLTANTQYWVIKNDANSFWLATSAANAAAGTKINTSGSQSGTHTLRHCPYGVGDGSTTFNVPNFNGRVLVGLDASDTDFNALGKSGGSKLLQDHNHTIPGRTSGAIATGAGGDVMMGNQATNGVGNFPTGTSGGGNSGNLQPYRAANYLIKT